MIAYVLLRVFLILLLVAANAFFAAAEFSLVSVRDTRIQQLIAARRIGATGRASTVEIGSPDHASRIRRGIFLGRYDRNILSGRPKWISNSPQAWRRYSKSTSPK